MQLIKQFGHSQDSLELLLLIPHAPERPSAELRSTAELWSCFLTLVFRNALPDVLATCSAARPFWVLCGDDTEEHVSRINLDPEDPL